MANRQNSEPHAGIFFQHLLIVFGDGRWVINVHHVLGRSLDVKEVVFSCGTAFRYGAHPKELRVELESPVDFSFVASRIFELQNDFVILNMVVFDFELAKLKHFHFHRIAHIFSRGGQSNDRMVGCHIC